MQPRHVVRVFIFAALLIAVLIFIGVSYDSKSSSEELIASVGDTPTFIDLSVYFKELADTKGASYAFDVLKGAELPPNIDLHLLGHIVGDELYVQDGIDGIKKCTQDFRNACSHAVVIGALLENGEGILPQVVDACHDAPGGTGAYTMCFHGFGHGALAYSDYTLPNAIEFCQKVGTEEFYNREYVECVGGTIMEMIAGVHNKEAWEKKSLLYFKENDPLYPCSADFIDKEVRAICYTYLTPHLFEAVGADLGRPTAEDFDNAFKLCSALSENEWAERDACYRGFGKEFVVLAQNRDIRKIEDMSDEQLGRVFKWCLLADTEEGIMPCMFSAVGSLFWGGENDREVATRFCSLIKNNFYQEACFGELVGAVSTYISDDLYREAFCEEVPLANRGECKEELL